MKLISLFIILTLSLQQDDSSKAFIANLKTFCGKSYEGKVVFPEDEKDPFFGKKLVINFDKCSDNELMIPFAVGDDNSRTWIISITKNGILLKHDHRHEDGTPDEITMYGGESTKGTAFQQTFPADAYTATLIPRAATNEWTLKLSEDKKTLSYILKKDNELRFQADFNME